MEAVLWMELLTVKLSQQSEPQLTLAHSNLQCAGEVLVIGCGPQPIQELHALQDGGQQVVVQLDKSGVHVLGRWEVTAQVGQSDLRPVELALGIV